VTLRPILLWPDPLLSRPCAPVADLAAVQRLAADMLETMYAAPGRGLAAPQVGVLHRLFVMDAVWKDGAPQPMVMVNPEMLWRSDRCESGAEACLSIPGISTDIERPVAVRLRWTDLDGGAQEALLEGAAARIAQHQLDHLDGIVTLDRLPPERRAPIETDLAR